MPEYKLYLVNGSCALVPHALLRHLNIPATTIQLKVGPDGYEAADGSFTNAEYRAIHPSGYVPAFSADKEVITEQPAILTYISSLAPDNQLLGRDALERARVAEWLAWLAGTLHGSGFAMWLRPGRFSDDQATHDAIRAKGMKVILSSFDRIEIRLQGRTFAVGQALTVVDFYLYIFTRWGKEIGIDMGGVYPSYTAFAQRAEKIKGIKAAIGDEGIPFVYA